MPELQLTLKSPLPSPIALSQETKGRDVMMLEQDPQETISVAVMGSIPIFTNKPLFSPDSLSPGAHEL